ncbi:unnamed protein product [Orchesella dallaii]|uniref:Uncharacterized protein n=1 Tax=Orchesella dallaii TaxID=48710 RepID=A0ABP1PMK3_9HEXA
MMMHEHVNHGCSQNLVFINTMISRDPKSRPKCDSLLRLPLFLSQNARLSILETSFESVWNEIKNLNLQGACKFDHTEEIEVLKKIGIDYTHNRCVVTLAYAECLKRGVGERIKISRNNEVGMRKLTDNRSIPRQITRTLDTNGDESLGIDMYGNSSSKTLTALKSHSISHNAIVTTPIVERHTHVYKHQQSSPTILDDTKSRGSKMQNNDLVKKTDETHSPTPETSSISSITKRIKGMFGNVVGKSEKSKPVENSVTGEQKERIRKIMAKLKQAKKQEPILFELVESEDLCVIKKILKSVAARVDITEICIGNESYSDSGSESESDSEADSESEYEYDYEIGTSLLHVAVEHRDYDVVEYLVNEQGFGKVLAKPNFQTLVRDCMEEIAEPDIRTFDQKCMILELLFNKCPSLIESRDDDQSTPLHLATETDFSNGKQVELIKRLLCRNTNVNAKDGKGFTPLHLAVCEDGPKNVIDIIHLLFAHHADPNVKDNDGRSFLHIAAKNVPPRIFQEIIMYLVSMDMTNCFNIHDTDGCTVLHVAVMYMKGDPLEETLQLLKTHGVNFNAVDYVSDSVMFKAIAGGRNESFLNTLIRFGADWTILNINNNTALHYAACYNNFSAIKMFIRFNCDVNAKDKDGDTPLHEAINYSDTPSYDVIHELLVNGADPRLQNNKKQSTIHIAQQKISLQKIDHRTLQLLVNYSY